MKMIVLVKILIDIDEGTSTDTENSHTEDAVQFNTLPHLVTHERTMALYNYKGTLNQLLKHWNFKLGTTEA